MRSLVKCVLFSAAVALVLAPLPARADGYVSPFIGTQFGSNWNNGRAGFGVQAGYMGAGIIGGEFDFGYSPSFFGTTNDFGNNSVIDAMANIIVGAPIGGTHGGGVRPYGTFGVGLLRTQIDGGTVNRIASSNNGFGWNAGAGVMGFFNQHVGLRGDLRYMRGFQNLNLGFVTTDGSQSQLHFWRASIGLALR